jgi:hypothetical protein
MYTAADEDLLNGIKSLSYAVAEMIKNTLKLLERHGVHDTSSNACMEALLSHARKLHEFLGKPHRSEANHEYPTSLATDYGFPNDYPLQKPLWSQISGSVSHLTYANRTHEWELQDIVLPILRRLSCFAESYQVQKSVGESNLELQKLQTQLDEALASVVDGFSRHQKTCFTTSSDMPA